MADFVQTTAASSGSSSPARPSSGTDGWERSPRYAFYESLGSPKTFVAPMVEHSDLPYRMMCRRYGADVVFTQMLHAKSFAESAEFRRVNFVTNEQDRPLIVQFNGDDPETLLAAARLVEGRCDAVDVNLGCPQGIAKRGHYGAFLMEELDLLTRIVSTMSKGLKTPVTCKTRIYKDFDRSVRLCETLVQAGASMLTIHGRTREEKGCMVGAVDWDMIRRLKEHFKGRVPIVANGGIETWDDVQRCLEITKCDGVMSSEAILENPTIFATPRLSVRPNQLQLAEEYLQLCEQYPEPTLRKKMRSHIMKFLHRYFCVHADQRNAAGVANSIEEHTALINELKAIVSDHSDYEKFNWYRRHRNAPPRGSGGSA